MVDCFLRVLSNQIAVALERLPDFPLLQQGLPNEIEVDEDRFTSPQLGDFVAHFGGFRDREPAFYGIQANGCPDGSTAVHAKLLA